jgi:hypothetical protein
MLCHELREGSLSRCQPPCATLVWRGHLLRFADAISLPGEGASRGCIRTDGQLASIRALWGMV